MGFRGSRPSAQAGGWDGAAREEGGAGQTRPDQDGNPGEGAHPGSTGFTGSFKHTASSVQQCAFFTGRCGLCGTGSLSLALPSTEGTSPSDTGDRAGLRKQERARLLRGQSVQQVGPQGLLYVQQRELAVTSPKDGSISILGSDDATTCHIVVLRHTGNGATCLTHCDGTDTKAEVPLIMSSIKSFSDHAQGGRLEVHLVGGFSDDRQLSQKLTHQLLSEFDRQEEDIHLVTLCVTELNDREENENHFPIIYGIAVNIKTAEIYRASFPDRGPEEELRAARALTGGPMISIYDAETEQLRIGPYSWMPFPHVDFWLQQDDQQILENLSTSPLAEPPHFVQHIRSTLMFLKKHPSPTSVLFPGNKALLYKKNEGGLWEKISCPGS
nr:protein N-terminal asparagine amidohydrolase [Vulpes vulpes]